MNKIYLKIKEEIYQLGIEKILEENYKVEIVGNLKLKENEILITDEDMVRDNTVVIYNDLALAICARAKIKLLKNTTREELLVSIEKAANNESYIQKTILDKLEEVKLLNTKFQNLNEREIQLIEKITKKKTNKQIAKELYLSEKTIKNNLTQLYKKLNIKSRDELVEKIKL